MHVKQVEQCLAHSKHLTVLLIIIAVTYKQYIHNKNSIRIISFVTIILTIWRRQWHPIPGLLPGKSHGRRSLVGSSSWGR